MSAAHHGTQSATCVCQTLCLFVKPAWPIQTHAQRNEAHRVADMRVYRHTDMGPWLVNEWFKSLRTSTVFRLVFRLNDTSYVLEPVCNNRVNVLRQSGHRSMVMRREHDASRLAETTRRTRGRIFLLHDIRTCNLQCASNAGCSATHLTYTATVC